MRQVRPRPGWPSPIASSRIPGRPAPVIPQATSYSCGAAAFFEVLVYWAAAFEGHEADLHAILDTTEDGTSPRKIVEAAKGFGLDAVLEQGLSLEDLRKALSQGETVILDLQAWTEVPSVNWQKDWDDGHYVVLVAIDDHYVYLADPSLHRGYGFIPHEEFLDRWHDFEERAGVVERFVHTGIRIRGKNSLREFPGQMTRVR